MILNVKRIDFENGTVTQNILGAAIPMLVAQILNLLYNIVDRIYIARIPNVGTAALGAVGLCFPLIVIITAFANLFGSAHKRHIQRPAGEANEGYPRQLLFKEVLIHRNMLAEQHAQHHDVCPAVVVADQQIPVLFVQAFQTLDVPF